MSFGQQYALEVAVSYVLAATVNGIIITQRSDYPLKSVVDYLLSSLAAEGSESSSLTSYHVLILKQSSENAQDIL